MRLGIITDTQGFILSCHIGPANENDREGIKMTLSDIKMKYSQISKIYAEMGYQGNKLKDLIRRKYNIDLEIVKRPKK